MKGRKFLQLAGRAVIACPMPALSQQSASLPLVVVLGPSAEQTATARTTSLREGFKQAGLVEGKNYVLALGAHADIPLQLDQAEAKALEGIIHAFVQEDAFSI
jgi:hypothetical protein